MFDASVNMISWSSTLVAINSAFAGNKIVGRDRHNDCFPTKILTVSTTPSATTWRQITAGGNSIICLTTSYFWTTVGLVDAASITTSHLIFGLSGSSVWDFTTGPASPTHTNMRNNYNGIVTSMAVTANNAYVQTATAYGINTTVGRFWANRLLVRDQ